MAVHIDPLPTRDSSEGPGLGAPRTITYLRISVTDRCNLRCRYCMPEDQDFFPRDHLLHFEELVAVARVMVDAGVRKIRITGGEPLMRRQMPKLIEMLRALSDDVQLAMTTNAMLLAPHAQSLRDAGLDRLNVSLDTLRPERFERISRRAGLDAAQAGLVAAADAGFTGTKLNSVVMGGFNDDEIPELLTFAHEQGHEQRFIEFMPLTSNAYGLELKRVPVAEIRRRIETYGPLAPRDKDPGPPGPAETFTIQSTGQRVGIIAAISLPFCETCNRVRLTADGRLRSCLFEGGEVDVRALVRGADDLDAAVGGALDFLRRVKPPVHDGVGHVQMNQVGG